MGIPDGAHTHGSGGGGLGTVVLVIVAAALLGPAVAAAVAALLHALVIVAVALAAVAGAVLVAAGAWRVRQQRQEPARVLYRATPAPAKPPALRTEARPALEAPQVHVHHHWHGVSPEDVAELIRRQQEGQP